MNVIIPPPLHQNNHILMSKTITEFEDKVRIFLGIVGEPQLSDKNFDVWRSIDLNKKIKKKSPDNRAQVLGDVRRGSAKSTSLTLFWEAFP